MFSTVAGEQNPVRQQNREQSRRLRVEGDRVDRAGDEPVILEGFPPVARFEQDAVAGTEETPGSEGIGGDNAAPGNSLCVPEGRFRTNCQLCFSRSSR